ncbi:hypothetical protein LTR62_002227 [Meristemomyces frigidus]|uniref:Septin-type G domain-containing protein n=1 Tax=Meristemomyces frigidus TaxID=1508187 RepID=A0AAN7TL20_9PEZI|nr:hypothetical protein LTR62_002227 [Meristemomyces frigidus]
MTFGDRSQLADNQDYTRSHRTVPSVEYHQPPPSQRAPSFGNEPGRPPEGATGGTERKRRGSFSSLLRRSPSSHGKNKSNTTPLDAPPLPPVTRIAQVQAEAAQSHSHPPSHSPPQAQSHLHARSGSGFSNGYEYQSAFGKNVEGHSAPSSPLPHPPRTHSRNVLTPDDTMFRTSSKARQAEQERLDALAQQVQASRPPPRLPSINDFYAADQRPDSFQIFSNQYHPSTAPPVRPPATTANFSRPGQIANSMSSSSNHTNSSSPAYNLRTGNAFAQQASVSPAVGSAPTRIGSNGEYVTGALDRNESMAHRGRYSYTSSSMMQPVNNAVNSPRRVRRRKDPTPFNVLVVGARNSGKTSFISFLRHSLALPVNRQPYDTTSTGDSQINASKSAFVSHYLETELDGERVGLTLWDSAGLEKHLIDLQLRETTGFVESKFEETFVEEQKVNRSPGAKDTHIHCVFFLLEPNKLDNNVNAFRNGKPATTAAEVLEVLDDDMDLQVIRALWGKTTVIPVISKADTLTAAHMAFLKRSIWKALKAASLDPIEALELEEDEGEEEYEDAEEAVGGSRTYGDTDTSESDILDEYDSNSSNSAPRPSKPSRSTHNRQSSLVDAATSNRDNDETPYIPMSFLSPDLYDLPPYAGSFPHANKHAKIGRKYAWGFADPYDPEHCDFVRLRDSIFGEWRQDLRELARTKWYENWRTLRLRDLPGRGTRRVKGGITPTGVVPREGRMASGGGVGGGGVRQASGEVGAGGDPVPRSVSRTLSEEANGGRETGQQYGESRGPSKAERMMGISVGQGEALQAMPSDSRMGEMVRGVESYQ